MNVVKISPKSTVWKTKTEPLISPFVKENLTLLDTSLINYESPKIDYYDDLLELTSNLQTESSSTLWNPSSIILDNIDKSSWFSLQTFKPLVTSIPHNKFVSGNSEFKQLINHWIEKNKANLDTQKQPTNFSKSKKTLKIRLLPVTKKSCCFNKFKFVDLCDTCKASSNDFKKFMKIQFGLFRWYENFATQVIEDYLNKLFPYENLNNYKGQLDFRKTRDLIKQFEVYKEEDSLGRIVLDFYFRNINIRQYPVSPLWDTSLSINSRIPAGAIKRAVANMNSYIANEKHRKVQQEEKQKRLESKKLKKKQPVKEKSPEEKEKEQEMEQIKKNQKKNRKKNDMQNLYFDDSSYSSDIKSVLGYYSFGNRKIPLSEVLPFNKGGANYQYDRRKNRWYLYLPVDVDWKPEWIDRKYSKPHSQNENQGNERRKYGMISFDPGCVIFMCGYSPENHLVKIGEYAGVVLQELDRKIDKYTALKYHFVNRKWLFKKYEKKIIAVQKRKDGLVKELHWKTINFVLNNYEVVLLPKFEVSKMIKKNNKKITKKTKRLLTDLSFYKFKQRILNKKTDTKVFICDEKYTSKVCSNCGHLNQNIGGEREFICENCEIKILRDPNSGKNITTKNWHL